jgi:phosphatidylglycerol---prolipoprotein diacylglyceryl transferase
MLLSLLTALVWDFSNTAFHIGTWSVRWYGILFALGFFVGQIILTRIYEAEGKPASLVDVITFYMIIGTVVGARLGHCLFYEPEQYLKNPLEILKIWHGGLASHGATVGILFALWLFSRREKLSYLWVLDRIVIVVGLGGAFIRLGNMMNSEIIGRPTDLPWGVIFPLNPDGLSQVARHPTPLYEAGFCFLLVGGLYLIWRHYKAATPRGLIFGLFVVLLFTQRFLLEFLKENQVPFENGLPLNMGQILSIPLILVGVVVLMQAIRRGPEKVTPLDLQPTELPS